MEETERVTDQAGQEDQAIEAIEPEESTIEEIDPEETTLNSALPVSQRPDVVKYPPGEYPLYPVRDHFFVNFFFLKIFLCQLF